MSVVDDCLKELDIMGKQLFDLQMDNARLKKDHTNSLKPSSSNPNHATIHNSREKTGRNPGGQTGHVHHPRKKQNPDKTISIPAPEKYLDKTMYTPTGRTIRKQLVKASGMSRTYQQIYAGQH